MKLKRSLLLYDIVLVILLYFSKLIFYQMYIVDLHKLICSFPSLLNHFLFIVTYLTLGLTMLHKLMCTELRCTDWRQRFASKQRAIWFFNVFNYSYQVDSQIEDGYIISALSDLRMTWSRLLQYQYTDCHNFCCEDFKAYIWVRLSSSLKKTVHNVL